MIHCRGDAPPRALGPAGAPEVRLGPGSETHRHRSPGQEAAGLLQGEREAMVSGTRGGWGRQGEQDQESSCKSYLEFELQPKQIWKLLQF